MTQRQVGYCTNVHAGAGLAATQANLQRYALEVKRQTSPTEPMGIGLWLSNAAAREVVAENKVESLRDWLAEVGLVPFTFNGFPFGDFHQKVVKHLVYLPTWFEQERLDYTLTLARIQDAILPTGLEGSISTLPLAWGTPAPSRDQLTQAANNLRLAAEGLAKIEQESGRLIYLCIEPEPGCVLDTSDDLLWFYGDHLLPGSNEAQVRRHIRVCHDVCHAAVMFEGQTEMFRRLNAAGIGVGKVQVSSAVIMPLDKLSPTDRALAVAQLSEFHEERYLHQTVVSQDAGATSIFYEDLQLALASAKGAAELSGEWRTHFHVPVYLEKFGLLETSRPQILECLQSAAEFSDVSHFEVETYAWNVLPRELRQIELADGIAKEMKWFSEVSS